MSEYVFVSSTGENIPIIITTRRGLRNITLRPKTSPTREIHISKPWISSDKSAIRFVESKRRWIENIFASAPQKQSIAPGDVIEFLGRTVTIHHDSARRANQFVVHDEAHATLIIGGGAEMFESRVRNFVKAEFLKTARELWRMTRRPGGAVVPPRGQCRCRGGWRLRPLTLCAMSLCTNWRIGGIWIIRRRSGNLFQNSMVSVWNVQSGG